MTTDETLRLLRLAEAVLALIDANDEPLCGVGMKEAMAALITNCDPTTIAALCRANLRLVAMEEAVAWDRTRYGYNRLFRAISVAAKPNWETRALHISVEAFENMMMAGNGGAKIVLHASPPPAPKVGDGFVSVPREPTVDMLAAAVAKFTMRVGPDGTNRVSAMEAAIKAAITVGGETIPEGTDYESASDGMCRDATRDPVGWQTSALAASPAPVETDPCNEMLGLSEQNGWGTRDADDRAWVLSRFREWDSAASLFPASDRPIAIRLAIRLLTLKEDEVEQPWNDVDRTLPPSGVFVETMRTGERLPNVCAWKWARIGTDVEWYERGKPGDPGRTTITHSTFVPPTHWRPIRTGSAS